MKVLFLTQYFPPEVGAPQNRLYEMAIRLKRMDVDVDVLTAVPNYPSMEIHEAYKGKLFCSETMEGMRVFRTWIYARPSKGLVKRLLNYYSFAILAFFRGLFLAKPDVIFVESPPLFLGKTAWLLSVIKGSKMLFNVSDLWPESAEKLDLVTHKTALKMATMLEEFLYKKSAGISGQTQGIVASIKGRFPDKPYLWLPNGADLTFYDPQRNLDKSKLPEIYGNGRKTFFYGGIIGHAQGLEIILEVASMLRDRDDIQFVLQGSGPEKEGLQKKARDLNLKDVVFLPPVAKQEMPAVLDSIYCSIIPLRKLDLFKGAIPSKIFEALAMEKWVLLGVEGEAHDLFVNQAQAALPFEPENALDLHRQITALLENETSYAQHKKNGRTFVEQYFSRDAAAKQLKTFMESI